MYRRLIYVIVLFYLMLPAEFKLALPLLLPDYLPVICRFRHPVLHDSPSILHW